MTKKVECAKSSGHGFHDADSQCPWCDEPEEVTRELPAYDATAWAWVDQMLAYQGTTKSK